MGCTAEPLGVIARDFICTRAHAIHGAAATAAAAALLC